MEFYNFLIDLGFTEDSDCYNLDFDSGNRVDIVQNGLLDNQKSTKLYYYNFIGRDFEKDRYDLGCTVKFDKNNIRNSQILDICNRLLQLDNVWEAWLPEQVRISIKNYLKNFNLCLF